MTCCMVSDELGVVGGTGEREDDVGGGGVVFGEIDGDFFEGGLGEGSAEEEKGDVVKTGEGDNFVLSEVGGFVEVSRPVDASDGVGGVDALGWVVEKGEAVVDVGGEHWERIEDLGLRIEGRIRSVRGVGRSDVGDLGGGWLGFRRGVRRGR